MKLNRISIYLNTIKYLKPTQVYYQLWYRLKRRVFKYKNPYFHSSPITQHPSLNNSINNSSSKMTFNFLNLSYKFQDDIDWNYLSNGKLWCYNLNYFDFIHDMDVTTAESTILDYINQLDSKSVGIDPYCISLRGINWIKWLVTNPPIHQSSNHPIIQSSLLSQFSHLTRFLEYHLQGNHLLENVISLLWAGIYFQNDSWTKRAKKLLSQQLKEQILPDGSHFELSPMYHQILLGRLLDICSFLGTRLLEESVSTTKQSSVENLQQLLKKTISNMLTYLNSITFSNGDIPMVNDSTYGIAPTTNELNSKAGRLGFTINSSTQQLNNPQLIRTPSYELFIDVAQIGPDYIPGHAHADTFSFILNTKSPFIVDTSISTYENNELRHYQRSTKAHNTVEVNGKDSSQVWSSFRVANRAKVYDVQISDGCISAKHDGYKSIGCIHERIFEYGNEIEITDILESKQDVIGVAYFHFNDDVKVSIINNTVIANGVKIEFNGQISIDMQNYKLAKGFNDVVESIKIAVKFNRKLITRILI